MRTLHSSSSAAPSVTQRVKPSFNLVDEPWIPCMESAHAAPTLLSLRQAFAQAPRLWQIADPSPVVTISLYRLLLAILHRSLGGPRNAAEWTRLYSGDGDRGVDGWSRRGGRSWDPGAIRVIDDYLSTWWSRFDLFDAQHPFYQTPGLPVTERTGSATILAHERASGRNQPLLFDHTTSARAWLEPAAAARALLTQQNFAVGGLISYDSAHEPIANKYVSQAPLLGAAVCLVRGATLFETLMLNCVRYSPEDDQPFPFRADDQPAWERAYPPAPIERIPDGYVDLLTWQSRRILLVPAVAPHDEDSSVSSEPGGDDRRIIVQQAVLMKGYQLSPGFDRRTAETMLSFRKSAKATKAAKAAKPGKMDRASGGGAGDDRGKSAAAATAEPWYPLSLQSDRFVWRDSQALLQSVTGVQERPRTLDWLATLMVSGSLDERRTLPLDVYGMIPDQATIEDWRHESLPLPLALLRDGTLLETIGQAIAFAESLAQLLLPGTVKLTSREGKPITVTNPMDRLAEALLVGPGISCRTVDRKAREALIERLGATRRFWAQLNTPFRQLIVALSPQASSEDDIDATGGGAAAGVGNASAHAALVAWTRHAEGAVRNVFHEITADLDTSARSMRAVSLAQERFAFCLKVILESWRPSLSSSYVTMTSTPSTHAAEVVVGASRPSSRERETTL